MSTNQSDTLAEIYQQFTRGSPGFAQAVSDRCGFGISQQEIRLIAHNAPTAAEFQRVWEEETWWQAVTD